MNVLKFGPSWKIPRFRFIHIALRPNGDTRHSKRCQTLQCHALQCMIFFYFWWQHQADRKKNGFCTFAWSEMQVFAYFVSFTRLFCSAYRESLVFYSLELLLWCTRNDWIWNLISCARKKMATCRSVQKKIENCTTWHSIESIHPNEKWNNRYEATLLSLVVVKCAWENGEKNELIFK